MGDKLYEIPGYSEYMITKSGKVYSKLSGRFLKQELCSNGYYRVTLKNDSLGEFVRVSIHRLVATTFLKNPRNLPEVNHKDGNKRNNSVYNLEWCTRQYNVRHAINIGLMIVSGEDSPSAKLTEEQVREIYKYFYERKYNKRQIARVFNVTDATIGGIVKGKTWTKTYEKYFGKPSEYKREKRKHISEQTYRDIIFGYYVTGLNTVQLAKRYNLTNAYIGKLVRGIQFPERLKVTLKEIRQTLGNQQPSLL